MATEIRPDAWPAQWQRGLLPTALLGALSRQPMYGYLLTKRLEQAGWGAVPGGTLYPALRRLEEGGLVVSEWSSEQPGPARKYYALTPQGREAATASHEAWLRFSATVSNLFSPKEEA